MCASAIRPSIIFSRETEEAWAGSVGRAKLLGLCSGRPLFLKSTRLEDGMRGGGGERTAQFLVLCSCIGRVIRQRDVGHGCWLVSPPIRCRLALRSLPKSHPRRARVRFASSCAFTYWTSPHRYSVIGAWQGKGEGGRRAGERVHVRMQDNVGTQER